MVSKNIERIWIRIRIRNQNADPDPGKRCGFESLTYLVLPCRLRGAYGRPPVPRGTSGPACRYRCPVKNTKVE